MRTAEKTARAVAAAALAAATAACCLGAAGCADSGGKPHSESVFDSPALSDAGDASEDESMEALRGNIEDLDVFAEREPELADTLLRTLLSDLPDEKALAFVDSERDADGAVRAYLRNPSYTYFEVSMPADGSRPYAAELTRHVEGVNDEQYVEREDPEQAQADRVAQREEQATGTNSTVVSLDDADALAALGVPRAAAEALPGAWREVAESAGLTPQMTVSKSRDVKVEKSKGKTTGTAAVRAAQKRVDAAQAQVDYLASQTPRGESAKVRAEKAMREAKAELAAAEAALSRARAAVTTAEGKTTATISLLGEKNIEGGSTAVRYTASCTDSGVRISKAK